MNIKIYKTFFILSILVFAAINVFSQEKGYEIKVKIKGSQDSIMFLVNYYTNNQYIKDTTDVNNKAYAIFQGKEKLPGGIYLAVMQNRKYFEFIVDKEQHFILETDTADFVKNMKVKNSPENTLFYKYLNFIVVKQNEIQKWNKIKQSIKDNQDSTELAQEKIKTINEEVKKYKMNFVEEHPEIFMSKIFLASQEPEVPEAPPASGNDKKDSNYVKKFEYQYYKDHFWDGFDFSDDRLLRTPIFYNKLKRYWGEVVLQQPDSLIKEADWMIEQTKGNKETFKYLVWYTTYKAETSHIMGLDKVFVHLTEKYYMTNQAYWLNEKVLENITKRAMTLKRLLIGEKAPNLLMTDSTGKFVSLHNVKAKYTVLYFWDTECGHCKKETPKLYELYKTYKAKGLEVYAISTDRKLKKWTKYVNDNGFDWINVYDEKNWTNYHKIYDIIATPVVYLLDENKVILAKKLSVDQLKKFIERDMKKNEKK